MSPEGVTRINWSSMELAPGILTSSTLTQDTTFSPIMYFPGVEAPGVKDALPGRGVVKRFVIKKIVS